MLGWMTRQGEDKPSMDEPPQTPGPVFALRAFKSTLFGTPAGEYGAEDDSVDEQRNVSKDRSVSAMSNNNSNNSNKATTAQQANRQQQSEKQNSNSENQLSLSPTKSILMTPGTTSNRRKTVSFGGALLNDEVKKDNPLTKTEATTLPAPGSVTSQWLSNQGSANSKPRSRLTQSLLDARERPTEELPRQVEPARSGRPSSPDKQNKETVNMDLADKRDDTINLDDPQSQSGKYWKAEFESYRRRTNDEIRQLIRYRATARSYARKKDLEAQRLKQKLEEEERKAEEIERHVTGLASNMVSNGGDVDKEKLIQDLTRQTALAVQYKHKVDTLRRTLQRHGVVGEKEEQTESERFLKDREEIYRLQFDLEQAKKKLEERENSDELEKLRELAKSSESRVLQLEKENAQLKKNLTRFKEEQQKWDMQRVEKETKLKQRVTKFEKRSQEYREKFIQYRDVCEHEREIHLNKIALLESRLAELEASRPPHRDFSPPKDYAGVRVQDFGDQHVQVPSRNPMDLLQVGNQDPDVCQMIPSDLQDDLSDEQSDMKQAAAGNKIPTLPKANNPSPPPSSPPSPSTQSRHSPYSKEQPTAPPTTPQSIQAIKEPSDSNRDRAARSQTPDNQGTPLLPLLQSRWAPSTYRQASIGPERAASDKPHLTKEGLVQSSEEKENDYETRL